MSRERTQRLLDDDSRYDQGEVHNHIREEPASVVRHILATIEDPEGVIDVEFETCCTDTIRMIDHERFLQGWSCFTDDENIILVHEMFRTCRSFGGRKRHSGTSYFFDHLHGTVEMLVKEEGIVGLASVIAGFKHDNVEDLIDNGVVEEAVFTEIKGFLAKSGVFEKIGPRLRNILEAAGDDQERALVDAGSLIDGWCEDAQSAEILREYGLDSLYRISPDKGLVRLKRFVVASEKSLDIACRLRPVFVEIMEQEEPEKAGERLECLVEEFEDDPEIFRMLMKYSSDAKIPEEQRLYEELVDLNFYRGKLSPAYNEGALQKLKASVVTYLLGVTKFRKAKKEDTAEATFERLLSVARDAVRVIFLKLADRAHNIYTLDGHGSDARAEVKKLRIMRETREQYLPLARILKIRNMIRFFVERCCRFENFELFDEFEALAIQRRAFLSRSARGKVVRRLQSMKTTESRVDSVNVLPLDLSQYTALTDLTDVPFSALTLQDLDVGEFDPMQEILITFSFSDQQYDRIEKLAKRSAKNKFGELKKDGNVKLKADEDEQENVVMQNLVAVEYKEAIRNLRLKAMNEIEAFIKANFADTERCDFESKIASSSSPEHMLGKRIVCFNPEFGRLRFRVNDAYAEERSKRGVLAESLSGETPRDVVAMINNILQKSVGDFKGRKGIKARAKEELLKPLITVYTPKGDAISLPQGSTALDFAAAVHTGLVGKMIGTVCFDNLRDMKKGKPVDVFAPLEDGKVYEVRIGDQFVVKPEWLLFANSVAAGAIRKELGGLTEGDLYVLRLGRFFNIEIDELRRILADKYHKFGITEITTKIGAGKINPALALAEYIDLQNRRREETVRNSKEFRDLRKSGVLVEKFEFRVQAALSDVSKWEIEVIVPEAAGSLFGFAKEFTEKEGFKIDWFKSHEPGRDGRPGVLHLVFDLKDAEISVYEFLVKVVKLNFRYSVRIANPIGERFKKRGREVVRVVRAEEGSIDRAEQIVREVEEGTFALVADGMAAAEEVE